MGWWVCGWVAGWIESGWVGGRLAGWLNGWRVWVDGWTGGWMDGCVPTTDNQRSSLLVHGSPPVLVTVVSGRTLSVGL